MNSAGNAHGNCGQDSEGGFVPCAQRWGVKPRERKLGACWGNWDASRCLTTVHFVPRDAQCGKLQCQGGEQSPLRPHTEPVDSILRLGSRKVTCRGAFLLPGAQLDLLDLGLVEPGTQCGPRMVSAAHPTPPYRLSPTGQSVTAQCTHCPTGVPGQALPEHHLPGAGALRDCLPWPWGKWLHG